MSQYSVDDILSASQLPPPGPDHYLARRKLWLTPRQGRHIVESSQIESSTSLQRLERLLDFPHAAESDEVWNGGIESIWKGLNAGGKFKRRLPMALIIKIVHAAWLRDNTWPLGAVAPEPDDILLDGEPSSEPKSYPPLFMSGTEPCLAVNLDE